ncbi:mechanosensitive ion channel family protein [Ideonella sp. DXS22W]|uniref:Small-conductance mechanosensitive channel n=1 Tax=Pseudaquabacterium inlustre TaxID=2984192 RepID=A0ABU9CQ41_9BURK
MLLAWLVLACAGLAGQRALAAPASAPAPAWAPSDASAALEVIEARDPRRLVRAAGVALAATLLAWALLRGLLAARRWLHATTDLRLQGWHARQPAPSWRATYAHSVRSAVHGATTALAWLAGLLLLDVWAVFVLGQFALTRPWAERSREWLQGVAGQFFSAIASAVPGLLTVALIFALARLLQRAASLALRRVERGDLHMAGLDADTAGPTRRIGSVVIWLFALAIAYPFLPGAESEAFKGVSVLAGLMLSLGASGVVGQVVSGMSLMYSRTLRVGEYVKIGDVEGTVAAMGLFATRIHTGMGEEVSLPNAVVFGQPVRNFSRLVADGQFVLHTAVTIGYATPWRQVHAMLLEAARRTPGVATEPAPYVVQTALSDFYVEYRLCAQGSRGAPRRRVEAMNQLLGHIQDVFNENGVQIMSPHYRSDPPASQVVPPADWAPPLAPRAQPPESAGADRP